MKKSFSLLAVLALSSTLFFTACDNGEDISKVTLHFHPSVGTEDFAFNQTYTINDTLEVQFTLAQFYTHGFNLLNEGGEVIESFPDKYFLVKAGQMMYDLGDVPTGKAQTLQFNIGVDSITNGQTTEAFTSRPEGDPLAQQSPSMHWNWNSGYIFAKFEGLYDSNGDNVPDAPFTYHIGRNSMLRQSTVMPMQDLTNAEEEIMIHMDFASLFNGIDLVANPVVHGMSATFMDNLRDGFDAH